MLAVMNPLIPGGFTHHSDLFYVATLTKQVAGRRTFTLRGSQRDVQFRTCVGVAPDT